MIRRRLRRPSPAMVVAVAAFATASGGSAVADDVVEAVKRKFINGSSIKARSLPGDRVKKNALGGTEVNESKLGKVPLAGRADSAVNAGHASGADTATNAGHATTADG